MIKKTITWKILISTGFQKIPNPDSLIKLNMIDLLPETNRIFV